MSTQWNDNDAEAVRLAGCGFTTWPCCAHLRGQRLPDRLELVCWYRCFHLCRKIRFGSGVLASIKPVQ